MQCAIAQGVAHEPEEEEPRQQIERAAPAARAGHGRRVTDHDDRLNGGTLRVTETATQRRGDRAGG
jgi:hypothetical protein